MVGLKFIQEKLKNIGPGTLIAAAFIGPGTVTVCTLAGANFGYSLLWAMLLSIIATIVLQEMAARTGILTQKGLAAVIKQQINNNVVRGLVIGLILIAIVVGNAAYEAGNIGGAVLGLEAIFGAENTKFYVLLIGLIAFILLYLGIYKVLEKFLITLVIVMSVSFIITAILTKPSFSDILKGFTTISVTETNILTIVALIGTTVVPYNLFLHASIVSEKWTNKKDLKHAQIDTFLSIILGGLVSVGIIISAAAFKGQAVESVADIAQALTPLYGKMATYFLGIGLFAAGITSAITAPLAAAYVARSCFNWEKSLTNWRFRLVWMFILLIGVGSLFLNIKPIQIIKMAQVANGILLPFIAIFLVWVVNKKQVLGAHKNTLFQNILAIIIVLITCVLGVKSILKVITNLG